VKDSRQSDPEEPSDRHKVFWVYALVLGGGVVIFFLGGLLLRNPDLPSYLYSQVSSWLTNHNQPGSGGQRLPPKTAEDYLALTNYDVRTLTPAQKTIALALADLTGAAADSEDRLIHLAQIVRNDLPSLRSADAIAAYLKIRTEATKLLDAADRQKDLFENLESNLAAHLEKSGLSEDMAKQVAHLFYERTPGQKAVDEAAPLQKLATELLAVANLLSETPGKWAVSPDGAIWSTDKKLDAEYRAHRAALDAAAEKSNQ